MESGERREDCPSHPGEHRPGPTLHSPLFTLHSSIAVVVVCAIFLLTSTNRLNHTDLWGHLNFGRWIVTHGSLPAADPFRSDSTGHFVNIPWLAQVLGYACHQTLGLEGLVLAHAGLVALTALVLIFAVRARGVDLGWGAAAAVAAYVLALPIVGTIRPQLFGMLGFALTLYGVALLPSRRSVLVWLPVVFALWANLHGSFPMGLLVLGCYALGATWSALAANSHPFAGRLARRAWLALFVALVAVCLNPAGLKLLGVVTGFSGNANLEGISEWRPMVLKSLSGVLFYGSLVLTALLLRRSPRRTSATEILLLLAFGLIASTAIRMLIWWALVLPWVVAPHVAARWPRRAQPEETEDPAAGLRRLLLTLAAIGLTVWLAPPTHALCTGHARDAERILSTDTPKALADWMCQEKIHGRLYAPMDWADYLIWRTAGAVQPLVHSHVHLVSPSVWQDFLAIDRGVENWPTIAARHGLDYLVVSRRRHAKLARSAAETEHWPIPYNDPQAVVFASPVFGNAECRKTK